MNATIDLEQVPTMIANSARQLVARVQARGANATPLLPWVPKWRKLS